MKFSLTKKIKENGYASIVETLVSSVILVIAVTAAGVIINSGLRISLQANNTTKALEHAQDTLTVINATPYQNLGLITSGGDNQNTVNLSTVDTDGCSPFSATFESATQITNASGVPYCQIIYPPVGDGITYNIETHITEYDITTEETKTESDLENISPIEAKKITIIVSWFEGEIDELGAAQMKNVRTETILTPTIDTCVPDATGSGTVCLQ